MSEPTQAGLMKYYIYTLIWPVLIVAGTTAIVFFVGKI